MPSAVALRLPSAAMESSRNSPATKQCRPAHHNLVFDTGQRHFISCLPNNESLGFGDLDLSILPRFDHLSRAGVWFSETMLRGGNRRPFEVARAGGLATSIDVNWDPRWNISSPAENQRRKQAVRDLLPLIDLVHGNIRELTAFAGCGALEDALAKI